MTTNENNDELYNLFASLDEVSASEELKAATISHILSLSETAGESPDDEHSSNKHAPAGSAADEHVPADITANEREDTPPHEARSKSSRSAVKSKWRVIRIAAIAACLALALSGGVAYAFPATHYEVTRDGATVNLGVNCFGITVCASSDDEIGKEVIASEDLRNIPYEQAASRASESIDKRIADRQAGNPQMQSPAQGEPEGQAPQAPAPPDGQQQSPGVSVGHSEGQQSQKSQASMDASPDAPQDASGNAPWPESGSDQNGSAERTYQEPAASAQPQEAQAPQGATGAPSNQPGQQPPTSNGNPPRNP